VSPFGRSDLDTKKITIFQLKHVGFNEKIGSNQEQFDFKQTKERF
jgi:hypothetical protein